MKTFAIVHTLETIITLAIGSWAFFHYFKLHKLVERKKEFRASASAVIRQANKGRDWLATALRVQTQTDTYQFKEIPLILTT